MRAVTGAQIKARSARPVCVSTLGVTVRAATAADGLTYKSGTQRTNWINERPAHKISALQRCLRRPVATRALEQSVRERPATEKPLPDTHLPERRVKEKSKPGNQGEHEIEEVPYSWTKQWWPVTPISHLDPRKPSCVTLLGRKYAIWRDQTEKWNIFDDKCPHRLAQLSEGRLDNGNLACSYHGWQFDAKGQCVKIPQIADDKAMETACSSSRTCVQSYPTKVVSNLLFVWLDSGPPGDAQEAFERGPNVPADFVNTKWEWSMMENCNDYVFWLEQAMDPSHAPFLHHGVSSFKQEQSIPMQAEAVPISKIDIQQGWTWHHGGYNKGTEGMKATRQFGAPALFKTFYDMSKTSKKGPNSGFVSYVVPIEPGVCRTFFNVSFSVTGIAALLVALVGKLPHWFTQAQGLGDQDVVIMRGQEQNMREYMTGRQNYSLFARADEGIKALHEWLRLTKYDDMWKSRLPPGASLEPAPKTMDGVLSRYERHTKYCVVCQKGLRTLTTACTIVQGASLAFAALAAITYMSGGQTLNMQSGLCLLGSGVLYALKRWLEDFREERFLSGNKLWRRKGGLSLVS